jgi:hypothetical protein
MNFTMRVIEEDGTRKISLGTGLVFPLDALPHDLRRRIDIATAHIQKGDDMRSAMRAMTREAVEHLWGDIMLRVAHRGPKSVCDIGQDNA